MENSNSNPEREKQLKAYELVSYLRSVHFNNEVFVESLHTMFVAYAKQAEPDDEVVNSYLNLRSFLRKSEDLLNSKDLGHA